MEGLEGHIFAHKAPQQPAWQGDGNSTFRNTKCKICEAEFETYLSLAIHLRKHKAKELHTKPVELATLATSLVLTARGPYARISSVEMQLPYKCKLCGLEFAFDHQVEDRAAVTHRPLKCKVCGVEFETRLELANHLHRHQVVEEKLKSIMAKRLAACSVVTAHQPPAEITSIKTNFPHKCKLCGLEFAFGRQLGGHIIAHRCIALQQQLRMVNKSTAVTNELLKCKACGIECKTSISLAIHSRRHKVDENKLKCVMVKPHAVSLVQASHCSLAEIPSNKTCLSHKCKLCGLELTFGHELRGHVIAHRFNATQQQLQKTIRNTAGTNEPFKCKACGIEFKTSISLAVHSRRHKVDENKLKCVMVKPLAVSLVQASHCSLAEIPSNKTHLSHKCKLCVLEFGFGNQLGGHVAGHRFKLLQQQVGKANRNSAGTNKPVICKLCGIEFKTSLSLAIHSRKHKHNKICQKVITRASSSSSKLNSLRMVRNVKICSSSSIRTHVCEMCNKTFMNACTLKRHINIHHKFCCIVCKRFVDKRCLSNISSEQHKYLCVSCNIKASKEATRADASARTLSTVNPDFVQLVSGLVRQLVDKDLLKSEKLLDKPVEKQLSAIVELCGEKAVVSENGPIEEFMSENIKRLFSLSVGKQATDILLRFKSVEDILISMLT